jgi:hypothetical protein
MDECVIEGNGDMKIYEGAILHIGSPEGIDKRSLAGNIQLRGAVELHKKAVYLYDGHVRQSVGNGLPSGISRLVINNQTGVFMQSDLAIDWLDLESGFLYTGPHTVRVGTSVASTGIITRKSGLVRGAISKWYGPDEIDSLRIVAGDEGGTLVFRFSSEEPQFRKGLIELKYHPGKPDDGYKSPFAAKQIPVGITEFGYFSVTLSNGPDDALLVQDGTVLVAGGESVSKWKMVRNNSSSKNDPKGDFAPRNMENFLLGPNPFKDNFTMTFSASEPTLATVQIVGKNGKVLFTQSIPVEQGKNKFEFTEGSSLQPGDYVLRISNPMEIHTVAITKSTPGF